MIIKVLEPVCYATTFTTPVSDGAESRSVWISAPLSRFSPEFHDFPKFLPGGLEEAVRPDGQLFPHKLPTACPNLSLGSETAAGGGQEVFSMLSRLQTLLPPDHLDHDSNFLLTVSASSLLHAINLGSS